MLTTKCARSASQARPEKVRCRGSKQKTPRANRHLMGLTSPDHLATLNARRVQADPTGQIAAAAMSRRHARPLRMSWRRSHARRIHTRPRGTTRPSRVDAGRCTRCHVDLRDVTRSAQLSRAAPHIVCVHHSKPGGPARVKQCPTALSKQQKQRGHFSNPPRSPCHVLCRKAFSSSA